ncbi:MAG: hypothetical protein J2P37_06495 [Ktedonobacteraceae bacterium]|nr:hypothetical protein [Ktedonobacteraceae bacterium]
MIFDRLRYEIKLMGKRFFLTPIVMLLGAALLAFLLVYIKTDPARFLLALPEILLPLAAGMITCTVTTQDPALELHLTMPRRYYWTSTLRLVLVFLWIGCAALLAINVLAPLKLLYPPSFVFTWPPVVQWLTLQMVWLAPMLWFMAVGLCAALIIQSRAGSSTLLAAVWVLEIFYKDFFGSSPWLRPFSLFPSTLLIWPATNASLAQFTTYWLISRFEVLGTALVLLPVGWLLLRSTERLLKGATQE